MAEIVHICAGEYEIGDDSIPNAGPRHRRRLGEFWMDARPVSWGHFEVFVAGGGYGDESLWESGDRVASVDGRVRELLPRGAATRDVPVTGLSWFEAGALARFYGARLPFEVEWEAAMRAGACALMLGLLQEWAGDAYTARYWRADFERNGVLWTSGADVVVRSSGPEDLYHHISARLGRSPAAGHVNRGFRRVWDREPDEAQVRAEWRG